MCVCRGGGEYSSRRDRQSYNVAMLPGRYCPKTDYTYITSITIKQHRNQVRQYPPATNADWFNSPHVTIPATALLNTISLLTWIAERVLTRRHGAVLSTRKVTSASGSNKTLSFLLHSGQYIASSECVETVALGHLVPQSFRIICATFCYVE
jgi:hypothetical protein